MTRHFSASVSTFQTRASVINISDRGVSRSPPGQPGQALTLVKLKLGVSGPRLCVISTSQTQPAQEREKYHHQFL